MSQMSSAIRIMSAFRSGLFEPIRELAEEFPLCSSLAFEILSGFELQEYDPLV